MIDVTEHAMPFFIWLRNNDLHWNFSSSISSSKCSSIMFTSSFAALHCYCRCPYRHRRRSDLYHRPLEFWRVQHPRPESSCISKLSRHTHSHFEVLPLQLIGVSLILVVEMRVTDQVDSGMLYNFTAISCR